MSAPAIRPVRVPGEALVAASLLAAFLSLPAVAVCPPGEYFAPPIAVAIDGKPNRVVLGDFDIDGDLDAACSVLDTPAGTNGFQIAVLPGDGSGGFGPPAYYTVGSRPASLCAAFLDADDKLDLAVSNWSSNTASILVGAGDGTFLPHSTLACGVNPYDLVATDLDADGVRDLVVALNGQFAIQVFRGTGDGSFAPPVSYPLPGYGLGVAAGHLDADGFVDVVATAHTSGCVVFLGTGGGSLGSGTPVGTGPLAYTLSLGDLDADGRTDLAVGNSSFGGTAVLKGTGTGGFGPPAYYGAGLNIAGITTGDFDHDAIPDFAATSVGDNTVRIYRGGSTGGVPTGTFSLLQSIAAGTFPVGIAAGKLDSDDFLDLVTTGYVSRDLLTLLSTCPATPPGPEHPHLVSVRDVANDEGGRVFLRWTRSSLDSAGVAAITAYRIWRRLPPEAAALRASRAAGEAGAAPDDRRVISRAGSPAATTLDFWEWMGEIPAQQLPGYGFMAPTLQDSTAAGNPYTAFFVTALTGNSAVFYGSNVDSGYSVDNLAPPPPAPFEAAYSAAGTVLHWEPSAAADVAAYRLYRGASAAFVPDPSNLVASVTDTGYVDSGSIGGFYKLSAVDVHGNEGGHAFVALPDVTGVADGGATPWLAPPGPNPVRLGARLRFALSREGPARLALYDLQGRLVRELARGPHAAGPHAVAWDGRDRAGQLVRSGLYVLTLAAEGRTLRTRLVVAR